MTTVAEPVSNPPAAKGQWFRPTLRWTAILIVAGVYLFAALPKLADPSAFFDAVDAYRLLPLVGVSIVATFLPWIELFAALALFVAPLRLGASYLIMGMTLVFVGAIVSALLRGLDISCGCFGSDSEGTLVLQLGIDLVLIGLLTTLILFERRKR